MVFAIAVDIGATKAAIASVNSEFEILEKVEVPTGNHEDIWQNIARETERILRSTKGILTGVGIGSAGPLDLEKGSISPVNIPSWREFPIVEEFRKVTRHPKVVLHGDAMALADAEHQLGAGIGAQSMLGMVVSTGVGGGLVINGKLVEGNTGNASFFGHHSINFQGELCVCARFGCVEAYASGTSMVKQAKLQGWGNKESSFIDLAQDARDGNEIALRVIDAGTRALAVGIVNVCAITDVNVVVVGGGVSQSGEIFWNPLLKHIRTETSHISFLKDLELREAKLVRDAGLLGAALGVISPQMK